MFDETTTGAESDIVQLTEIVRQMVSRWGMSPAIGPLAVASADGRGPYFPGGAEVSERTQQLIDEEMRRIVDESHDQVVKLLRANRDKLDALADALLEHETLDEEDCLRRRRCRAAPDAASGGLTAAARTAPEPEAVLPYELPGRPPQPARRGRRE